MYVRKFEADSLDEALKTIKKDLGPDAIILKTVTNKGLKGAFKKKRIEVTAAISEEHYLRKTKVDNVLDDSQKKMFYSDNASYIKDKIDTHQSNSLKTKAINKSGYGDAGLNRQVKTVKEIGSKIKSSLDDFLSGPVTTEQPPMERAAPVMRAPAVQATESQLGLDNFVDGPCPITEAADNKMTELQKDKIDDLEKKLFELTKYVERLDKREPIGLYELRTTLRSLDISDSYIQNLIKKAIFELDENQTTDADTVFEFALREMVASVSVEMPLFSTLSNDKPAITIFVSDSSSGQTSMLQKVAALKENSVIIRNNESTRGINFAENVFGMEVVQANGIAEIVSECRKATEQGKTVFVDYKPGNDELSKEGVPNQTKKFIDGLRRAFDNVEVLITLSAIHSELYNRKVVAKYRSLANGLVISHLDECLNFGALFNIGEDYSEQPFKFFGTGEVVPDDLETATAERILAGIFQFE